MISNIKLVSKFDPSVTFNIHYNGNEWENGWNAMRGGKDYSCKELYSEEEYNFKNKRDKLFGEGCSLYNQCMRDPMNASLLSLSVSSCDRRLELGEGYLSNYAQLKSLLIKAGGKYRDNGFDFDESAQDILDMLLRGEVKNDKKKFQSFFTPKELSSELVELACIDSSMRVLEPSAGGGSLCEEIMKYEPKELVCCELWRRNVELLEAKGFNVCMGDFLDQTQASLGGLFDCIVANPPFSGDQDIDHVYHMYSLLKEGGRMVSVMSRSWVNGTSKKQRDFKDWLECISKTHTLAYSYQEIDKGVFKESGTNVATCYIIINKNIES